LDLSATKQTQNVSGNFQKNDKKQVTPIGFFIGLIGVLILRINNSDKRFLNIISVLVVIILSSDFIDAYLSSGLNVSLIASGLFIIFYTLRFSKKTDRTAIDLIKPLAVILVTIYPLTFVYYENDVFTLLGYLTIPVSVATYSYDRLILKPEPMKKKFIITLVIQTILILVFLTYAYIQKIEADKLIIMNHQDRLNAEKMISETTDQIEKLKIELENCR
jgi:uncharacterized membrane protein (UPF0136 family)